MKKETHATFATGFAVAGAPMIHMMGYSQINYWLTIPILAIVGKEFAKLCDADHGSWNSVPDHTPFYWVFNKLILLTGGKHRSLQTHSLDLCAIFLAISVGVSMGIDKLKWLPQIDAQVISLFGIGGGLGWLSHLIADMLTPEGVWLVAVRGKKKSNRIALVPRKGQVNLPFIRKMSFATGGAWEEFVRRVMFVIDLAVMAMVIWYGVVKL